MINDIDIDVEMLTVDDFEDHQSPETRLYTIEQAKVAHIRKCIQSGFIEDNEACVNLLTLVGIMITTYFTPAGSRNRGQDLQTHLKQQLDEWKANIPESLRYRPGDNQLSFQALALEVLFK